MRETALEYIICRANIDEQSFLSNLHELLPTDEGTVMQLYQQNRQRHMQQGLEQAAKNMLKKGFSKDDIKDCTGLSDKKIEELVD